MSTGKEEIYPTGGKMPRGVLRAVYVVSVITLVVTIVVVAEHLKNRSTGLGTAFYACWFWWLFAPPIWFSVEYFWLFKRYGPEGSFEAFKYGQELASRAWFGISAVLTVIASQSPSQN